MNIEKKVFSTLSHFLMVNNLLKKFNYTDHITSMDINNYLKIQNLSLICSVIYVYLLEMSLILIYLKVIFYFNIFE